METEFAQSQKIQKEKGQLTSKIKPGSQLHLSNDHHAWGSYWMVCEPGCRAGRRVCKCQVLSV